MERNELVVIVLAIVLLVFPLSVLFAAVGEEVYQTADGLEVTVPDQQVAESASVIDSETWESGPVRLSSEGPASATVTEETFGDTGVGVTNVDATENTVSLNHSDIGVFELNGAFDSFNSSGVDPTDESTDFSYTASEPVSVGVPDLESEPPVAAVDADDGEIVGTTHDPASATFSELPSGQRDIQLKEPASTVAVRDVTDQTLVDGTAIDASFTPSDGETVSPAQTTNGEIDISALPIDEQLQADIAPETDYHDRQTVLPSRIDQQPAYVLPTDGSVETVSPRLKLSDETGQEPPVLTLKRPFETADESEYRPVAGGQLDESGFETALESGQDYRLAIRDSEGQRTRLSEFTPTTDANRSLTRSAVDYDTTETTDGATISTAFLSENGEESVAVNVSDVEQTDLRIAEAGNESNTLLDSNYDRNVTARLPVPETEEPTAWNVAYEATSTDGSEVRGSQAVENPAVDQSTNTPQGFWRALLSLAAVIGLGIIAMRFSVVAGGIVTIVATVGLWLAGWMPVVTGLPTIAVSVVIVVLGSITAARKTY